MSFTPTEAPSGDRKEFPKIKDGAEGTWALPARVSLIVDLGTQKRPDFQEEYDENKEKHTKALARTNNPATLEMVDGKEMINIPQTPVRQVAVFADLTTERLDYGEGIGKKPARIMLNKSFKGQISGTPLTLTQSRDNTGKIIEGSPKTFHTKSLLTQLGRACGVNFVKNGNDITALAGKAFAATVESKKAKSGDDVYTNFKSATPMMEGYEVPELDEPCQLITFEEATADQIQYLWKNVKEVIKSSSDFEGSQIQQAMKEFDAQKEEAKTPKTDDKPQSSAQPALVDETEEEDPPF